MLAAFLSMLTEAFFSPWIITVAVFGAGLYVLVVGAAVERATYALLLMTWAATWYIFLVHGGPLVWAYGLLDVFAGVALYALRKERWQYIVIHLFAAMVLVHAAVQYGILFGGIEGLSYSIALNVLLVLQLLTVVAKTLHTQRPEGRWLHGVPYWPAARAWLLAPSSFGGKGAAGDGQ